jgi:PucR family transcriptional regulator, purine catabolism regulatory protein
MALWLTDLLADPGLGASVVAGHAGVDRRGPIRWAHISELADPTPWLEGGELLLTTALGVKDSPEQQRDFVGRLANAGVVAVGFAMGVSLPDVPDAMVAACDEHDLPLFTVPYEIPFIAVTRRVAHHVFEEHYDTLRRAVDLHRQVLSTVVAEDGIQGVLATVGRAMPTTALVVLDFAGAEIARCDPSGVADGLGAAELREVIPRNRSRGQHRIGGRAIRSATILLGNHAEAIVAAITTEPLLEHEELLFEQGVAGVSLELARHRSVRDANRARVDELLDEIMSGRADSRSVARALRRLGLDPDTPFRVLAVQHPPDVTDRTLCTVIEDTLVPGSPPLVGHLDGMIYAVVPDDGAAAEMIAKALTQHGWTGVRLGRSRTKTDLDALRAAVREATVALQLEGAGIIRDVDALGLSGLLAGIRDDLGASDFVTQVLGPVVDHDTRESSQLVATLRAYLAHGCRPGPAADELCVHRHTLTYRLERVRELTGRDPRSGAHLVEFGLALALLERSER